MSAKSMYVNKLKERKFQLRNFTLLNFVHVLKILITIEELSII